MVLGLGFLREWPEIGGKDWIWFGGGWGERRESGSGEEREQKVKS